MTQTTTTTTIDALRREASWLVERASRGALICDDVDVDALRGVVFASSTKTTTFGDSSSAALLAASFATKLLPVIVTFVLSIDRFFFV